MPAGSCSPCLLSLLLVVSGPTCSPPGATRHRCADLRHVHLRRGSRVVRARRRSFSLGTSGEARGARREVLHLRRELSRLRGSPEDTLHRHRGAPRGRGPPCAGLASPLLVGAPPGSRQQASMLTVQRHPISTSACGLIVVGRSSLRHPSCVPLGLPCWPMCGQPSLPLPLVMPTPLSLHSPKFAPPAVHPPFFFPWKCHPSFTIAWPCPQPFIHAHSFTWYRVQGQLGKVIATTRNAAALQWACQ